jgi:valyl-tRNA synthetase
MAEKGKKYDFKEVEKEIQELWVKKKVYKFDASKVKNKGKVYSIDTPPPYISGHMHIGHAFSYSQQDFIARFRRMLDGMIYYPFGTDDNGLPTGKFVEKVNKIKSTDMSRSDFIKLCLKTIKETTWEFVQDWKDIGLSADFEMYYSTIDKHAQKISQKSFIDLYKKGEIYKAEFPTIWCPECQTAIAQAELEDKELASKFSTLKFKVKENGEELLIATTRPELLPACVAVFVNPSDKRYKDVVGKTAVVPLFEKEVPILEDESADPEKGTGVLMICSYGDKFDVDAIQRHKLEPKIVFNKDGTANYSGYEGLKIVDARKKVLKELADADLITEQKDITHAVNLHDKCGTAIEFLPTAQWFTKILDKKEKLIEQGKKINWYPEHMYKRYENWIHGLSWDWNISRNRHFGVPIPVWECKKCNEIILASDEELPLDPSDKKKKCPKCGELAEPEKMVLDTWATSSLSPQISTGLTKDLKIPMGLRPQAHDIIRTWAFYTIVKSLLHENKIPWEDVVVSGFVTLGGEKMSKSKGNVISPKDVLNEYGADAMRYWAASSTLGKDLDYQEQDLVAGKKLVNKIVNASKFVFMNLEDFDYKKPKNLEPVDELFLNLVNLTAEKITAHFMKYEYSKAKDLTEQLFWNDFCDNYLELVKTRVYQGSGDSKKSAQWVLYQGLFNIMKMFAPILPFVTEKIYQDYFKKNEGHESIHVCEWPVDKVDGKIDLNVWGSLKDIISNVRQEKTKAQKSMKAEIVLTLDKKMFDLVSDFTDDLKNVSGAKEIRESGEFGVEFS